MEQPSHGEPRARWCSGDVTVVETIVGLCLGLERRLYWVEVVERSKVELVAWVIWKWSSEGYARAR